MTTGNRWLWWRRCWSNLCLYQFETTNDTTTTPLSNDGEQHDDDDTTTTTRRRRHDDTTTTGNRRFWRRRRWSNRCLYQFDSAAYGIASRPPRHLLWPRSKLPRRWVRPASSPPLSQHLHHGVGLYKKIVPNAQKVIGNAFFRVRTTRNALDAPRCI